jgi:preprotein translocase subunit YajC
MNCMFVNIVFFVIFLFHFNRQMADVQKRRLELLQEIKRKDRRTQHFVKDKQDTANLV